MNYYCQLLLKQYLTNDQKLKSMLIPPEMWEIIRRDMKCYYHNDMDGMACAAIIKKDFIPQAELYGVQYGMDLKLIKKHYKNYNLLFVVDFSFPKEFMEEINNHYGNKWCWIDHHKSAMEKMPELWNNHPQGLRDTSKAACD